MRPLNRATNRPAWQVPACTAPFLATESPFATESPLATESSRARGASATMSGVISALIALCLLAALAPALSLPSLAAGEARAVASGVSIVEAGDQTRFELELDRDLEFSVFALADPYRVIIDLPETDFRLPADATDEAKGLVEAFRFGLFSPGKSRVVIDLAGPVAIDEPVVTKPADDGPARLTVALEPTARAVFLRDFALNGTGAAPAAAPTPARATAVPLLNSRTNPKPVIVIDPGHGGLDPGASSRTGAIEKDIVLDFAKDLASRLRKSGVFRVVLTRTTDVFVSLDRRRQIAHENQADLFISIHADSIRASAIRGATVYTVSDKASDEEAAAIAAAENRADIIAGIQMQDVSDEVSDILIDLAKRDTRGRALDFAKVLVEEMRENVRLNSNPHRSASFVVLKSPDVASVLVELGYLSNRQDADALLSNEWRAKAATSVIDAVKSYFAPRLAVIR